MRYLLLIYSNPVNWEHPLFAQDPRFLALPPAEQDALTRESSALHREVAESGELVEAVALADPGTARTVRDGVPVPTDGPYVEAKEQLAGYLVVDCESPERATEIAARIRFAAVEVRAVMDTSAPDV